MKAGKFSKIYPIGIPLLLLLSAVFLVKSPLFQGAGRNLSVAITLDLLVTIPFVYFLLIRKKDIPKFTVLSVFILCMIAASFILPTEQQGFLSQVKMIAVPLVEIILLGFILVKTRAVIKEMKRGKGSPDFFDALTAACTQALPGKVGRIVATEIGVCYYLFFGKRRERPNQFTYYKKSGIKATIVVFIFLVLAETSAVHFIVQGWSVKVAWVLTLIGLYTCLQIIALLRSMDKRLFEIDLENEKLILRYGFFNQTTIPFQQIESLELNKRSLPKEVIKFSPLDLLDSHNTIIYLKEENTLYRIYGLQKKYKSLAIFVDEKEGFKALLSKACNSQHSIH